MALTVSRVGADHGGPFLTPLHGMYWARALLTFPATTYVTGGLSVTTAFRNAFGFSVICFLGCDHGGSDVTAACATGTVSECMPFFFRPTQKLFMYGIGRAAGSPGTLGNFGVEFTNGTSIDAMTMLCQVWGRL